MLQFTFLLQPPRGYSTLRECSQRIGPEFSVQPVFSRAGFLVLTNPGTHGLISKRRGWEICKANNYSMSQMAHHNGRLVCIPTVVALIRIDN